jgi:putative transposase
MSEKFRNKYRIPSARASWWNYGANAAYFITICTTNSIHYFGKVVDGTMQLSAIGKIAQQCWNEIPLHFPFVILDEFVVMPNHIHGIIIIDKPVPVQTQDFVSLTDKPLNKFGPQSKNLASIIRGFKIGVTKSARLINPDFAWQTRYHDHIIRDQKAHERISNYIQNNPSNWEKDKFHLKK